MKQPWMGVLMLSLTMLAGCASWPWEPKAASKDSAKLRIESVDGPGISTTSGYWRIRGNLLTKADPMDLLPGSIAEDVAKALHDNFWDSDEYFLVTVKPSGATLPVFPVQQVVVIRPNGSVSGVVSNTFWLTPIIESGKATHTDLEITVIRIKKVHSALVENFLQAASVVAPLINPSWTLTGVLQDRIKAGAQSADDLLSQVLTNSVSNVRKPLFTPFESGGKKAVKKVTVSLVQGDATIPLFDVENESLETLLSATNRYKDISTSPVAIFSHQLAASKEVETPEKTLTYFPLLKFLDPPPVASNFQIFCQNASTTLFTHNGLSEKDRAAIIWAFLEDRSWIAAANKTPRPPVDHCQRALVKLDSDIPQLKYKLPAYLPDPDALPPVVAAPPVAQQPGTNQVTASPTPAALPVAQKLEATQVPETKQ